jgi:hypothetical protein
VDTGPVEQREMNQRHLNILLSPGFLIGLGVLLLNDFVLKQQLHSGLTGKLSDFAGLFVFPLICAALFPARKSPIYILTALSFVFWKSAYSQPFIEGWNNLSFFSIERTVDYSDLLSLLALPFSYAYGRIHPGDSSARSAVYLVAIISIFAFTATSYSKKTAYENEYQFQISKTDLIKRMRHLPSHEVGLNFGDSDTFEITFDSCIGRATVTLREKDNQSFISLKEIDYRCPSGGDKQEMLQYFEKEFVNKLREEPVTKSDRVQYIWSSAPENRLEPKPQSGSQSSSPRR